MYIIKNVIPTIITKKINTANKISVSVHECNHVETMVQSQRKTTVKKTTVTYLIYCSYAIY